MEIIEITEADAQNIKTKGSSLKPDHQTKNSNVELLVRDWFNHRSMAPIPLYTGDEFVEIAKKDIHFALILILRKGKQITSLLEEKDLQILSTLDERLITLVLECKKFYSSKDAQIKSDLFLNEWIKNNANYSTLFTTGDQFVELAKVDHITALLILEFKRQQIISLLEYKHLMALADVSQSTVSTVSLLPETYKFFTSFKQLLDFVILEKKQNRSNIFHFISQKPEHFASLITTLNQFMELFEQDEHVARVLIMTPGLFERLFKTTDDCIKLVKINHGYSILLNLDIKPIVINLFKDAYTKHQLALSSSDGFLAGLELFGLEHITDPKITKELRMSQEIKAPVVSHVSTPVPAAPKPSIQVTDALQQLKEIKSPEINNVPASVPAAPKPPEQVQPNQTQLKHSFFNAYNKKLKADKSAWCGLYSIFAKSNIDKKMSLNELIQHAQGHFGKGSGKRSQEVMKQMGWLDDNNQVTDVIKNMI